MGMDVFGKRPTSEVGAYFRRNVWCWHPLADLVCRLAPELTAKCESWSTNDGYGLGARDSKKLAQIVRARLEDGTIAAFVARRDAQLAAMPDETCRYCNGTGRRGDPDATCNACDGAGKQRPSATWYRLSVADAEEFASFLESCGGFQIC